MGKNFWEFRNSADGRRGELLLYGDIASRTWYGDERTPKMFAQELRALGDVDEIAVRISSGGGDPFAAAAIGNELEQHPAKTVAHINGLCASSATIVACHCDKVVAARDSVYMIHPVRVNLGGYVGVDELREGAAAIEALRENIVNLYVRKTGRDKAEVAAQMDATSWWTAEQAKEQGFIDELTDEGGRMTAENRGGMLFINHVDAHTACDTAPEFVRSSLTAAAADADGFADIQDKGTEENGMDIKTVDELRAAFPELVDRIEQAAAKQAEDAERRRIRDIEDMALPGCETVTAKAKFETPMSAGDYAKAAIKHAKEQGRNFLDARDRDTQASGANSIGGEPPADADRGNEFMNAILSVNAK